MKKALSETDVGDLIARDIQSGVFAPGSWLKQIDLEQRYGRSRPEVRRALDRLAQKRLVQHIPNRGYHVHAPEGHLYDEVREIRLALETWAAGRIVAQADAAAVARLRADAARFERLMDEGTLVELYEANLTFHRDLLALCGNGELVRLVEDMRQRTSSAPVSQWLTRRRIECSNREHHRIVDAVEARDAETLKRLVELHIRQPESGE